MKRFLKWFFGILIFLLILVVGAAVSLPYLIDPNDYKEQIIAQIKPHMFGRDLKIPGKISLSVFPWLGVEIGDTIIGNAEGFVVKPFMTIKSSRAHLRLLSLLSDTPEIGSLEFHGVVVNLQRDAEGRNNWSDLAMAQPAQARFYTVAANTAPATAMKIPNLKIEGVHVKDAAVYFDDRQAKSDITLSKLDLDAGPIDQLNPIPVKGQFQYYSKNQGLAAASAFATTVALTPANKQINLLQCIINTNVTGETLNNKTLATSIKIPDLAIELANEKIDAKQFHLSIDQMQSEGRLNLRRFSNPIIRLTMDTQELDLDKILPASGAAAPVPAKTETGESTSPAVFAALIPLKTADMQGTLNFKKLKYKNLEFDTVKLSLLARGGLISALPEGNLYKGTYAGDLQIDVKKLPVTVRTKHELRDVPMGPITLALTGKESVTGTANIQGQFFSTGNTLDELTQQLNGDAVFNIRNVELTLMDVEQLILQDWYDKLKLAEKQEAGKKVTAFDSMRGTIRVKNGVAYNHDFSAVAKRVHLTGSGQANLVKQDVNYTLITIPKTSLAITVGNATYDLKDKRIPTYFSGPWSNIDVKKGLENAIKADVGSAIDTKKQAAQEQLQNRAAEEQDKLKDKLKNLLQK